MAVPAGKPFNQNAPHRSYKRKTAPLVSQTNAANEKVGGVVHRTTPSDVEEHRKTTGVSYVAMKRMKVNGVIVQPGTLVPAANSWRNVHNYVATGFLAVVGA